MGLIQSVIEKGGVPTVSISVVETVTKKVQPPRALIVDSPFGYPLIEADNDRVQRGVIRAALALLSSPDPLPLFRSFAGREVDGEEGSS